jgi:hypothetical protein
MTEEQILELVKEHFEEDWDENDGWEYSGNFDAFVKFARELYDKAKWEGYYDGYEMCSIDMGGEE